MSARGVDRHGRWRNKTIAFRVSQEEYDQITALKDICGMQKQDYIIARLLNKDVIVHGNTRVHKAMRTYFVTLTEEMKHAASGNTLSPETLEVLEYLLRTYCALNYNGKVICSKEKLEYE